MAVLSSLSNCASTRVLTLFSNPISLLPSVTVCFPLTRTTPSSPPLRRLLCVLRTDPDGARLGSQDASEADSLRKPISAQVEDLDGGSEEEDEDDWEGQILEDTVPLVGFVKMILHTGEYSNWDKLSPEHEKTIRERLLPYHPEFEQKIGPGIDYITVGYHPDYRSSRCLFIARKDGELMDFSYWKCIKGIIRKKYPLHAERFIHRHFQPRRNTM